MSIEAMKQALAKFEHLWEIGIDAEYKVELLPEIEALRQAIEQAEQWDTSDMAHRSGGLSVEQAEKQEHKPWCDYLNIMLTSLPPQKAKCNCKQAEKQEKLCKYCGGIGRVVCDGGCMPEQEPVAWIELVCALLRQAHDTLSLASLPTQRPVKSYTGGIPRYATDAPKHEDDDIQEYKRPWVGLTDEEIHKIIDDCTPNNAAQVELSDFAKAISNTEIKLKEKND